MTPARPQPAVVEDLPDTGHADAQPEALRVLNWPRGVAASIGFTLLAAVFLALPAVLAVSGAVVAAVAVLPIIAGAYVARLAYEALAPARRGLSARRVIAAGVAAAGAVALVALSLAVLAESSSSAVLGVSGGLTAVTFLCAGTVRDLEQRLGTANRRIVLVGSPQQYADLRREIAQRGDLGLAGNLSQERLAALGPDGLTATLAEMQPSTLVLTSSAIQDGRIVAAAAALHSSGVRVRSLPDFYEEEFRKVAASELSPAWFLFDVAAIHDHRLYGRAKRVMETVTATLLLVLVSPLLPLIALAIRLTSAGPVFFRQARIGLGGETVYLLKFRTMRPAPPDVSASWATHQQDRITPVGRFLRRYRLDELPQLFNVVRGDLALVGPRPEQPVIAERLSRELRFYDARHCVRPGLTGWAQVNYGYGGTMRDVVEKLQYEFFYIKHQSLMLDLRVLMATVRTILSGSGS